MYDVVVCTAPGSVYLRLDQQKMLHQELRHYDEASIWRKIVFDGCHIQGDGAIATTLAILIQHRNLHIESSFREEISDYARLEPTLWTLRPLTTPFAAKWKICTCKERDRRRLNETHRKE